MPFQFTFRADDITTWDVSTRDLVENRDRELELYSTTIDAAFTTLNADYLTSGTVPSARMTGAYTGITSVGTLGSLTVTGDLTVDTNTLRVDSTNNRVGINVTSPTVELDMTGTQVIRAAATQDGIQLAGRVGGTTGLTVKLIPEALSGNRTLTLPNVTGTLITTGNLSSITSVGTLASGSIPATLLTGTIASARLSGAYTGITGLGTISGQLTASTFVTNNASPSLELGDWSSNSTWSAVQGYNGYLLMGNTSDRAVYLRTTTSSPVRIGALETNALIVNTNSSYTSVEVDGGYKTSGTFGGYQFQSRNGADVYTWYSNNGDAFLYSSYFGDNVIGVARTTGITYLYRGVTGNVQYGFYGSLSVYGVNNTYGGIVFPDQASTMMVQNTLFGHYRNNSTWNFYVQNGTYIPSDVRYKRDIQPIEHGLNLLRHITPVSYDPLTENLDDDPETTVGRTHYGFTTQNILEALELAGETRNVAVVDIGGPNETTGGDRQYLNHSALIAPIVKAIQELDIRLQQLETT